jgi:hypothetical protein
MSSNATNIEEDWDDTNPDINARYVHDGWLNPTAHAANTVGIRDALRIPNTLLTVDRLTNAQAVPVVSGSMLLSYFVADESLLCGHVASISGGTAAATITTAKQGLYSVDPTTGNLTRIGVTPNTTTLFAAINTSYPTALSAAAQLTRGNVYALATLLVGTTMPTLVGVLPIADVNLTPRRSGLVTGQTDIPSSVLGTGVSTASGFVYGRLFV